MSVGRALFIQNGKPTQVGASDELQVGIIDSTAAGAITIGGTLATSILAAKRLNVDSGLDVSSAAPLNIGSTSASRINLGSAGNAAKVWIYGDLDVAGVEAFHGTATFSNDALFNGNVTFGDGVGTDTVSFNAATRIITDMTFGEGATRTLSIGASTTGNGNILQLRAGAPLAAGGNGGALNLNGADGLVNGSGGNVNVKAGDTAFAAVGTAGDVVLSPGAHPSGVGTSYGRVLWGHSADNSPFLLVNGYIGSEQVGFRSNGGVMQFRNTGGSWSNIGVAGGGGALPGCVVNQVLQGSATTNVWEQRNDLTLPEGARIISGATPASAGIGGTLMVKAADGNGADGGAVTLSGGTGASGSAGGNAFVYGAASSSAGVAGDAQVRGGNGTGSGAAGDVRLFAGDGTASTANGGNVLVRGGTSVGGTAGKACIYGDVKFESPNTSTPAQVDFLGGAGNSRIVSNMAFGNAADRQLYIAGSDTARLLTLHSSDALTATNSGGATTVRGGAGLTTGTGGALNLQGGASGAGGTGGSVYVNGGAAATNGNVYIHQANTTNTFLGDGTNGLKFNNATGALTLSAIGTGIIDLPHTVGGIPTTNNFKIGGTAVSNNVTATNLGTLTGGGDAGALHTHSGLSGSSVDVPVAAGTAVAGQVSYVSATGTSIPATAGGTAIAARALGVNQTATSVRQLGVATVAIEGTLVVTAGDELYLSAATAGKVTNVPPSTPGQFITFLGIAKTGATGPATCDVYLNVDRPLAL